MKPFNLRLIIVIAFSINYQTLTSQVAYYPEFDLENQFQADTNNQILRFYVVA